MTRGEMAYLVYKLMLEKDGSIQFDGIRNPASAGCGKEPPSTVPTSSVVNGLTRHYITVIGNRYDKSTPMKIIFAFHGRTNPNTMVRTYYDIEQASQGNAIIIYPAGLPEEGPSRNRSNP
jgi:polyhydroxybutyrate depolymerase